MAEESLENPSVSGINLIQAVKKGQLDEVELHLPHAKINAIDDEGMTALMHAADLGHYEIVQCLLALEDILPSLQRWEDSDAESSTDSTGPENYQTAMTFAIHRKNNEQIIKALLAHPKLSLKDKFIAFIYFAEQGNVDEMSALLLKGIDINTTYLNCHVLHWAAYKGQVDVIKWLLQQEGIKPNAPNEEGEIAFTSALSTDHPEVATCLYEHLDDEAIKKQSSRYSTPLVAAIFCGTFDLAERIINRYESIDATEHPELLACAIGHNHTELVAKLLAKGVDPNIVATPSSTRPSSLFGSRLPEEDDAWPLHPRCAGEPPIIVAIRQAHKTGDLRIVSCLLENGADMQKTNKQGQTAQNITEELDIDLDQAFIHTRPTPDSTVSKSTTKTLSREEQLKLETFKAQLEDSLARVLQDETPSAEFKLKLGQIFYDFALMLKVVPSNQQEDLDKFERQCIDHTNYKQKEDYWSLNYGLEKVGTLGNNFNQNHANFLVARAKMWLNNKEIAVKSLQNLQEELVALRLQGLDCSLAINAYNNCVNQPIFADAELTEVQDQQVTNAQTVIETGIFNQSATTTTVGKIQHGSQPQIDSQTPL